LLLLFSYNYFLKINLLTLQLLRSEAAIVITVINTMRLRNNYRWCMSANCVYYRNYL